MKIAVISDSHDNIWNLKKALEIIKQRNCEKMIHLGDFISPFMFKELDTVGIEVHGVFGNNDGDRYNATKASYTTLKNINLHGYKGELTVDEKRICFTHHPDIAKGFASTDLYDVVCFGHSHKHYISEIGGTLLFNPGEIMGKDGSPGFCILETRDLSIERIEIQ